MNYLALFCIVCALVAVTFAAPAPDPETAGCLYEGVEYKAGEGYMQECNHCQCVGNEISVCTKMFCGIPPSARRDTAETAGCLYKGVEYKAGENYMEECNHCQCMGNNQAICTEMACGVQLPPAPDAETAGCLYKGVEYQAGETYKQDCNTCQCMGNNLSACSRMLCISPTARRATEEKAGCIYKGGEYKAGESYMQECNHCQCVGSNISMCTQMFCGVPLPVRRATAETAGCLYKGVEYKAGEGYMQDCNHCQCVGNNVAMCTLMGCQVQLPARRATAETAGCLYKGVEYKAGESYMEECNHCQCIENNMAMCTLMACAVQPPARRATAETAGCLYKGVEYKAGEGYKQDCNQCQCVGNNVSMCTMMACVDLPARRATAETAGCLYKGVEYKAGESYMEECNQCQCGGNNIAMCTMMACVDSPARRATAETAGCLYKGVEYKAGENYMEDCNHCQCMGNNQATCTEMACMFIPPEL